MTPTRNNVEPTTSVTDELRRLLDERGVEWEAFDDFEQTTQWSTYNGAFVYWARERDGKLLVETTAPTKCSASCTPEQAVESTLGRRTCHVMTIDEFNGEGTEYYDVCSNCGYEFDDDPLNYCPNCGGRISDATSTKLEPTRTMLKPCPFCGSDCTQTSALIYAGPKQLSVTIACRECGASVWGFTTEEAVAAWNRRAGDE